MSFILSQNEINVHVSEYKPSQCFELRISCKILGEWNVHAAEDKWDGAHIIWIGFDGGLWTRTLIWPFLCPSWTRVHLALHQGTSAGTRPWRAKAGQSSIRLSNNNSEILTLSGCFSMFDLERIHVSICSDIRKISRIMQRIKEVRNCEFSAPEEPIKKWWWTRLPVMYLHKT